MAAKKKKFRNFDSFITERKKEAPTFEVFGKTFVAAPTVSYNAVLELQRLNSRDKDEELADDEAFRIFELFIGKENLAQLREHDDFSIDLASELVRWLLVQYGMIPEDGEDTGKKETASVS